MSEQQWTPERNADFIQAVRDHQLLYDMEMDEYHDRDKKVAAWEEVGQPFDMDATAASAKWNNLRDTYRTNAKKEKARSGAAADADKSKKYRTWAHLEQMKFLENFKDVRKTKTTLGRPSAPPTPQGDPSAPATPQSVPEEPQDGILGDQAVRTNDQLDDFPKPMLTPGSSKKKLGKRNHTDQLDELILMRLKEKREKREKSETELFAEMLVKQLDDIQDIRVRRRTQRELMAHVENVLDLANVQQPRFDSQRDLFNTQFAPPNTSYAGSSYSGSSCSNGAYQTLNGDSSPQTVSSETTLNFIESVHMSASLGSPR